MSDRKRLLVLLGIMTGVAMAVAVLSIWLLYQAAFTEKRSQLSHLARSQAQAMEGMADHFTGMGMPPDKVMAQTMSQFSATHENVEGFAETGELVLGRREGDKIIFPFGVHKSGGHERPSVALDSDFATPMRRALDGKSGTLIGPDYTGSVVISRRAPARLAASGKNAAHCTASLVGRIITNTPKNPIKTASQRRQPTVSPSNGDARAVMNSGPAKVMARASASGRKLSPVMKQKPLVMANPARADWALKLLMRITENPPDRQTIKEMARSTKSPRTNSNWPTG